MFTFTYIMCAYGHIHTNMYIDRDVNVCIYTSMLCADLNICGHVNVSARKKECPFVVFG